MLFPWAHVTLRQVCKSQGQTIVQLRAWSLVDESLNWKGGVRPVPSRSRGNRAESKNPCWSLKDQSPKTMVLKVGTSWRCQNRRAALLTGSRAEEGPGSGLMH